MVPDALPALPGRQWQRAGGGARFYTLARAWLLHIAVVQGPARQPPWQALPPCHHPVTVCHCRSVVSPWRRAGKPAIIAGLPAA